MNHKGFCLTVFLLVFFSICSTGIVSASVCGIDVYGLDVPNENTVVANIRNTGTEFDTIDYVIYINTNVAHSGKVGLGPGNSERIQISYIFDDPGETHYEIEMFASSECGAIDSESMVHVILDDSPEPPPVPPIIEVEKGCGIKVKKIETSSYLSGDETIHAVEVETKNTGDDTETVVVSIYVDDVLEGTETFNVEGATPTEIYFILRTWNPENTG